MIIYLENTKVYSKLLETRGEFSRSLVTKFICRNQYLLYNDSKWLENLVGKKIFFITAAKNNKYNTKCSEPKFKNEK